MKALVLVAYLVLIIATGSAANAAGTTPAAAPTSRPSAEAVARAARLTANINTFQLQLSFHGEQDKPFYNLRLSVPKVLAREDDAPFSPAVTIDPAQAEKIIAWLASDGFLERSIEMSNKKIPAPPMPCYTMIVRCTDGRDRPEYYDVLGWELPLLARLDGLRKVLDGDAGKSMDLLITRLSGLRRQWEDKRPATVK